MSIGHAMSHPSQFHVAGSGRLVAPPDLTLVIVPDLVSCVRNLHDGASGRDLTLDLSAVVHLDPRLVRTLLWADRYTRCHGGRTYVVLPRSGVLRVRESLALRRLSAVPPVAPDAGDVRERVAVGAAARH